LRASLSSLAPQLQQTKAIPDLQVPLERTVSKANKELRDLKDRPVKRARRHRHRKVERRYRIRAKKFSQRT
jgi:hypothetical protein